MSTDDAFGADDALGSRLPRGLVVSVVVGVLAVAGLVIYLMTVRAPQPTSSAGDVKTASQTGQDNDLEQARDILTRARDVSTCRSCVQQINTYLTTNNQRRPPPLTSQAAAELQANAVLRADELKEIEGSNYTLLDANHLDRCFLFQDAAAALALGFVGNDRDGKPVQLTPVQRAQAAFAWVTRMVAPFYRRDPRSLEDAETASPPQFVARRGSGTALERALVFLALLQGFREEEAGLHGCLVTIRDKGDAPPRLWACGVLADGTADISLFDPALGLPLPGKSDKSVATLAELRKDPGLLRQLQFGDVNRYDVTPAQIAHAEILLVFSLSALSPRMHHLQSDLLPPTVRANLAEEPSAELKRWRGAVAGLAKEAPKVSVWQGGTGLLRRFLPPTEGGVDQPRPFAFRQLGGFTTPDDPDTVPLTRRQIFEMTLVPWPAFPAVFRDKRRFPYNVGLGQAVRSVFARPFIQSVMQPGQVRDLLLRGQHLKAAELLVQERDRLQSQEQELRTRGPQLANDVFQWISEATAAYAQQLRAHTAGDQSAAKQAVGDVWKKSGPVMSVLEGAAALQRQVDVTFLLGLSKHEEATNLQGRIDLRQRAGLKLSPNEIAAARTAWNAAINWWRRYLDEYGASSSAPTVRCLLAEALTHTGNQSEAVALLEDLSGPMTNQDRVAHLARVRELKSASK